jgi:endo-1,4-beta-xylanase
LTISRRGAIAGTVAAGAALVCPNALAANRGTLGAAAAHDGRFFGCAGQIEEWNAEGDLRDAVLAETDYLVPEVALKWAAIEPNRGQLSFKALDGFMNFAARNRKKVRGHTLLWHDSVPPWAQAQLRENRDWGAIAEYFVSVIPRYGAIIDQWDVVNEPIETGGRIDGLRENVFLEAFGPEYIARALAQARSLAPNAKLMINEYGLEYDLPEERDRRYLLLKLLERLRAGGAPLDGLGIQSHLDLRKGSISPTAVAAFLKAVADLGLFIVVTELDVKESDYTAPVDQRDRFVADEARRYLETVLVQRAVTGVVTWGFSDRHSWLKVTPGDFARFPGAWAYGGGPGLNRGLPLNAAMERKPMYFAIKDRLTSH